MRVAKEGYGGSSEGLGPELRSRQSHALRRDPN
jgi:hypothetical protein